MSTDHDDPVVVAGRSADDKLARFTVDAQRFWRTIPEELRLRILENVWCVSCRGVTTIVRFRGETDSSGDLILIGECAKCGERVARRIESV